MWNAGLANDAGAVAVEFALVFLLMLVTSLGALETGNMLLQWLSAETATQMAARAAAIGALVAPGLSAVSQTPKNSAFGDSCAGKTTMLNAMSRAIDADERIITIEDAAELQMQQPQVARLETRPPNAEGRGEITQRDLVRNALRMRPDRIILGEVRAGEAFDMLQAMNTGHDGSMSTVRANNCRDALGRLEQMIGMADIDMPVRSLRAQIASAIQVVMQLERMSDGRRRLVSLQEITGMEGEVITMNEIFRFERLGIDGTGGVRGDLRPTGLRPKFCAELESKGIRLPATLFGG